MSRKTASVLLLASVVGCVREYHPEFHPETSYSYVQNVVTVVPAPPPVVVIPPPAMVASAGQVSRVFANDVGGDRFLVPPQRVVAPQKTTHPVVRAKTPIREVQYAPVFVADDGSP